MDCSRPKRKSSRPVPHLLATKRRKDPRKRSGLSCIFVPLCGHRSGFPRNRRESEGSPRRARRSQRFGRGLPQGTQRAQRIGILTADHTDGRGCGLPRGPLLEDGSPVLSHRSGVRQNVVRLRPLSLVPCYLLPAVPASAFRPLHSAFLVRPPRRVARSFRTGRPCRPPR